MSATAAKLNALRKKVPGWQEVSHFAHTFGATVHERNNISPMPKMVERILAETEFAIHLSDSLDGKYDDLILSVLDYLTEQISADGVLTNSVCRKAEEMLLPLSEEAKEYSLILCGHAHIDMNWQWGYDETVSTTIATFSTMLDIMDEYPEFCFSQSQASVYQIVDRYAPELRDRIRQRIEEGRWEITASAWVETDKNMPSTESLLRHIKYTKNYMRDNWGIDPDSLEVDFSPDTFGHSANLPEINLHGGVKYYYHCRGLNKPYALYRWKSQSGKELLMYREQYWYNSGITPLIGTGLISISENCGGLKTGLIVYGVGDHGGGPTRRDVEKAIDMMNWPVFPAVRFGTFREFFKIAESVRDRLPLVEEEMNCMFPGCYTTQSRIKRGNRRSEAALADAETLSAFAQMKAGRPMRSDALEAAWQDVLFTHFHDILTGSCVQDSREYAMGLYQNALSTANTEYSLSMKALSEKIDTTFAGTVMDPMSQAEGAGVGYHAGAFIGTPAAERGGGITRVWTIFNPTGVNKCEPLEITVWDWPGDLRYLKVTDSAGNPLEFQLIDGAMQQYWTHRYFRILVMMDVPALSYRSIALTQTEADKCPTFTQGHAIHNPDSNYVLENEYLRAEFSYSTGEMISMTDKRTGREMLRAGEKAGLVLVDTQKNGMSAWEIGTYLEKFRINHVNGIRWTTHGSLKRAFSFDCAIRSSRFTVTYSIAKNEPFIRCAIRADWSEVGGERTPLLTYSLPIASDTEKFMYNIPAGSIVRQAAHEDKPGLSYAIALDESGVNPGIITDCKYGFRGLRGELISTLINTATNPDPYPERGIQDIALTIGVFGDSPLEAEAAAASANHPLTYQSAVSHPGVLPADGSFLGFTSDTAVLSAVYYEDGALTVRVYSLADCDGTASFTIPDGNVTEAYCCTLMGEKTDEAVTLADGTVTVPVPAKTIRTIKIR